MGSKRLSQWVIVDEYIQQTDLMWLKTAKWNDEWIKRGLASLKPK